MLNSQPVTVRLLDMMLSSYTVKKVSGFPVNYSPLGRVWLVSSRLGTEKANLVLQCSLESFMEGHNWFLSQFVEIPRRSIMVCFLSLSVKAG